MTNSLNDILFISNESTKKLSFYGCEGNVKGAFYPKNEGQLVLVYNYLKINNLPFKIVGNGSNLLFSPKSKQIYIISMKLMSKKVNFKREKVYFSSSTSLAFLANLCYKKSLSGLEELSSIPATMGGAIKMNAGCFGKCIFDLLDKVKILQNGRIKYIPKDKIEHGYHHTALDDTLILGGSISLMKSNKCDILKKQTELLGKRLSSQPCGKSCGSVFKNPPNKSAGKLIELCGLKGISKNDAEISSKHANFIINKKNATFDDIFSLIKLCEDCVYNKFNIKLIREVEII